MKSVKVLFLICLVAILGISAFAYAEVPKMINYQGKITTSAGLLIDTTVSMVFTIYSDTGIAGVNLWSETQDSVKVEKGVFSVLLGSINPIPDSVFNGNVRYLGVKVGNDLEMTPRKAIVSVAYAYHSAIADTSKFAPVPADYSVSQAKLKTATGEVSSGGVGGAYIVPGGQYCFRSQFKAANKAGDFWIHEGCGESGYDYGYANLSSFYTGPWVTMGFGSGAGSVTTYAASIYVTSSGQDHWIFFLLDKETKRVLAGYQAPDHPCHGQGGDENDIPHPFGSYDSTKHEVILIDNDILPELKSRVTSKRSLLTVINEDYEVDINNHPVYKPREIIEIDEYGDKKGEIIKKIQTPEWAKILIGKDEIYLKRRLVETLPPYISYKQLKPKSNAIAGSTILSQNTAIELDRRPQVK